jgi:hypothetical protein
MLCWLIERGLVRFGNQACGVLGSFSRCAFAWTLCGPRGLVLRSGFPVAISSRQATKFVGNYSNGLIVSQTRHVAVIENLEDASFLFDRRIGGLAKIKELGVRRPAEF